MDLFELQQELEDKADELNRQIDFRYKDIIKMDSSIREEKTAIIRKRNELLQQVDLIKQSRRKIYHFNEDRYARYKNLNNKELLEKAVHTKMDAEFAGGKKYMELINQYEDMRSEFYWRVQNEVDVISRRRYYNNQDIAEAELAIGDKDIVIEMCEDEYDIDIKEIFVNFLKNSKDSLYCYVIKYHNQTVGGVLYDRDFEIRALVVQENFRCCGIGTRLFYKVLSDARRYQKKVRLHGLPNGAQYFFLKNNILVDVDEVDGFKMEIYEAE